MQFFLARGLYLSMLSEAQACAGLIGDALISIERAMECNPEELTFRPLIRRLRGELRLRSKNSGANRELAEQDFREALKVARDISARSLELRATTSLARLLRSQDRRDKASIMLAEIYNWFTEGFDTADLKEAKSLLDELSA